MNNLKLGYSDEILSNVYLQQIHNEDIKATFEYPENWKYLSLIKKASLIS